MATQGPEPSPPPEKKVPGSLQGEKVYLRPPLKGETEFIYRWLNDPETSSPWDRFSVDSYGVFEEELHRASGDENSLYPRFVAVERANDEPVGVVGYYRTHRVLEGMDVWYLIAKRDRRGRGLGTEAVRLLVDHIFSHSPVERVGATSDVENRSSLRLLKALGFRQEGSLRRVLFHHGEWHDVVQYGITREEWREGRDRTA